MRKETLKAIIEASNTCSKDETRYHITHVQLMKTGNKTIALRATDGCILIEKTILQEDLADFIDLNVSYLITNENIKLLKIILKSYNKTITLVKYKIVNGSIVVYSVCGNSSCTIEAEKQKTSYPDFKILFPKNTKDYIKIGLNLDLLVQLSKSISQDMTGLKKVTVYVNPFTDNGKEINYGKYINPVLIEKTLNTGVEDKALIMPMKL